MEKFNELKLDAGLIEILQKEGFTEPTEIQEKSIPLVLEGKDVLASSATGSGKTLAFGAGIIHGVEKGKGIQALVLAPTRELAEQVAGSLRKFSKFKDLKVKEIYGGVDIQPQIAALKYSDIVVGTPGRILDHIERKTIDLHHVKFLVLDEADRMLEMGFIDDVGKIIKKCPERRQTILFSATISYEIEVIGRKYMNHPQIVEVEAYVDASKLEQVFYDIDQREKFSLLVHLLKEEREGHVMVFCNTRDNTELVTLNLNKNNIPAVSIHGGLNQNRRNKIISDFHAGKIPILVCTDVATRGLDIKGVSHVYNYDIPKTSKEYIHRIGRTARAGASGKAVSLLSNRDYDNFRAVTQDDSLKIKNVPVPRFENVYFDLSSVLRGRRGRDGDDGGGRFGGSRGGSRGRDSRGPRRDSRSSGGSRGGKSYGRSRDSGDSQESREDNRRGPTRGGGRKSYGRDRGSSHGSSRPRSSGGSRGRSNFGRR